MSLVVRAATPHDADAIAAIYAPYVTDSVISFEYDPPDAAEMAARMATLTPLYPWLVIEAGGRVAGYAYGRAYQPRAAYRWACEAGIYLASDMRGKGLGARLYEALLDALEDRGYVTVLGCITLPNRASVRMHEKLGFAHVGTHAGVGFKAGRWHDVGFWQLDLAPRPGHPADPGRPR